MTAPSSGPSFSRQQSPANPVEWYYSRNGDEVPPRNFFCPGYDDCLSLACREDWGSFSCAQCPLGQVDYRAQWALLNIGEVAWERAEPVMPPKQGVPYKDRLDIINACMKVEGSYKWQERPFLLPNTPRGDKEESLRTMKIRLIANMMEEERRLGISDE